MSPAESGYDWAWRRTALRFLITYPHCEECGKRASTVDHIQSRSAGGGDEASNLQSLCASCHARKTLADRGGRGGGV